MNKRIYMSTANIFGDSSSIAMKALNFSLPTISLVLTTIGLEIDWQYVALVAGSSIAGSLVLGYFRREKTLGAQVYKTIMASIGGLIVGAAVVENRQFASVSYIALTYFVCSMLVLILVRTLVSLFEANAGSLTTTLIQRVFNVKLDKGGDVDGGDTRPNRTRMRRTNAQNDIRISHPPNSPPHVTIGNAARPDEIKIIEQTIVDTPNKDG